MPALWVRFSDQYKLEAKAHEAKATYNYLLAALWLSEESLKEESTDTDWGDASVFDLHKTQLHS